MRADKVIKRSKYYIYPVYAHKNLFNDTNSVRIELASQGLKKEATRATKEAVKIGAGMAIQGMGNRFLNPKIAASGLATQEEGQELLKERRKGHYFDSDWLHDKSSKKQAALGIKPTDVIWNEYVRINNEKHDDRKGIYPYLSKTLNQFVRMHPSDYNKRAKDNAAHHVAGAVSAYGYRLGYVVTAESPLEIEKAGGIREGTLFRFQEDAENFARNRDKKGHLVADLYNENRQAFNDVRYYTEEDSKSTQPSRLFEPPRKCTRFEEQLDNEKLVWLQTELEAFYSEKKKKVAIEIRIDENKNLRILEVKGEIDKEFFIRHHLSESFFMSRDTRFASEIRLDDKLEKDIQEIEKGMDEIEKMLSGEDEEKETQKPVIKHK